MTIETKKCIECMNEYPTTKEYFYANKSCKNGLSLICKNCHKKYVKKYQEANKEKISNQKKQYYKDNKNKILEDDKFYYENNKDKISKREKLYCKNNKDKMNIKNQKRRAKKYGFDSTLTNEQWENIKQSFNFKCAYCGEKKTLAQEHFIPLFKGGEYTHNNIVPSCKSCNSSKNVKSFFEWYPKYKHYSKEREQEILEYLNYHKQTKSQQFSFF